MASSTPATPAAGFVLPTPVYSPELLDSVVYEIGQYIAWYRENKIHQEVGSAAIAEPGHSTETALVIKSWIGTNPLTLATLEELLEHLRSLKLPVAHITLAALPNHVQRQQLVDWFRNTAGPNVLISFVGDRNLGGGILVRTPNRVFDYSWKQKLVEGRSKLAEVVKRV